jgi:hypothetical protein
VYPYAGFSILGGIDGTVSFIGYDTTLTSSSNITDFSCFPVAIETNYVTVLLESNSTQPIYIHTVHFSWLVFNKQYFNKANFASFTTLYFQGPSISYTNTSQLYSQTTVASIYSVHFEGDTFLNYTFTFNSPDSVTLASSNRDVYFKSMVLQFFTLYCHYNTPFLLNSTNVCYDVCPADTLADESSLTCLPIGQSDRAKTIIIACSVSGVVFIIIVIVLLMVCCNKKNPDAAYIDPIPVK